MDLQQSILNFSRRKRKALLWAAAAGCSAYGLYRLYHSPPISEKRRQLLKLLKTLASVADAVSASAESISVVSRDLNLFLQSDTDQIPNSLKQISKLARSPEFLSPLAAVAEAFTIGLLRGYDSAPSPASDCGDGSKVIATPSFSDCLLDKVFSTAGTGFASVVVGSFARSVVLAYHSGDRVMGGELNSSANCVPSDGSEAFAPNWVKLLFGNCCRELIGDCIQLFVSTAVAVYLDKTMDINTYDEFFTGMTNPKHESKVKEILVSVFNGAIETLVKTSHQVMTGSSSSSGSISDHYSNLQVANSYRHDHYENGEQEENVKFALKTFPSVIEDSGWMSKVSSTLAVPSNRRLVVDVTGRVTFETVRSFLDFFMSKCLSGLKKGSNALHLETIAMGVEAMRYISAKSVVVVSVCLALCLYILTGKQALVPA